MAAAQTPVPVRKRRWWSRPLIGLLFFLQPIARGWNRFATRLTGRTGSQKQIADSPLEADLPNRLAFWATGGPERITILRGVLNLIEQRGGVVKRDIGWSDYDAEVAGNPWSFFRITTATEELEQGKRNLHFRLERRWSSKAKALFWSVLVAELFLIATFRKDLPWLWMLPAIPALLCWLFDDDADALHHSIVASIGEMAKQHNFVQLGDP